MKHKTNDPIDGGWYEITEDDLGRIIGALQVGATPLEIWETPLKAVRVLYPDGAMFEIGPGPAGDRRILAKQPSSEPSPTVVEIVCLCLGPPQCNIRGSASNACSWCTRVTRYSDGSIHETRSVWT